MLSSNGVGTGGTGVGTGVGTVVGGDEEVTTAPTSTESALHPPVGAATPAFCISLERSVANAVPVDTAARFALTLVATVSDTPVIVYEMVMPPLARRRLTRLLVATTRLSAMTRRILSSGRVVMPSCCFKEDLNAVWWVAVNDSFLKEERVILPAI